MRNPKSVAPYPPYVARMVLPPAAPRLRELDAKERGELARWVGDSPRTSYMLGGLKSGLCRAYVIGPPSKPEVAVIHMADVVTEPEVYGTDPEALWQVLQHLPGWDCVHLLSDAPIDEVARHLESKLSLPSKRLKDLQYVLRGDPVELRHPIVRLLAPEDEEIVERSDPLMQVRGHGDIRTTLSEGVVAGAVSDGRLVSAVMTCAWGGRHVNLGAGTHADWRRQGLAEAETSLVCQRLLPRGLIPCWSTGETNLASQRVAERVGFERVDGGEYVIFEGLRPSGFQPK